MYRRSFAPIVRGRIQEIPRFSPRVWVSALTGFVVLLSIPTATAALTVDQIADAMATVPESGFSEQLQAALLLKTAHQYPEALAVFQKLAETNPLQPEVRYQLATLYAIVRSSDQQALEHARKAVELAKGEARYWETLADTQFRFELDDEVVESYQALLQLRPENIQYRYQIAAIYAKQQKFDACRQELEAVLRADKNQADAWALKGRILLLQNQEEEAEPCLEKALECAPNHLIAHMEMGKIAKRRNRLKEAERHFLIARDVNPFLVETYNFLSAIYVAQNKSKEAKRCMEAARHLQGMGESEKVILDHLLREGAKIYPEYAEFGLELSRLGLYPRAQQVLETAHSLFPAAQEIIVPLAMLQLENGAHEKAYQTVNSLTDEQRWFTESALSTLGWAAYHTHQLRAAEGAVAAARIHKVSSERLTALETLLSQSITSQRTRRRVLGLAAVLLLLALLFLHRRNRGKTSPTLPSP